MHTQESLPMPTSWFMDKNEVYVTTNLNDDALWRPELTLTSVHWIHEAPKEGEYQIRVRHRAQLMPTKLTYNEDGSIMLTLNNAERAVAAGQSVVIYDREMCLGGGIVA